MMYRYHSFLIHSSADGHLGCFYVLAIINSAEMNTGVHVSWLGIFKMPIQIFCPFFSHSIVSFITYQSILWWVEIFNFYDVEYKIFF